MSSQRGSWVQDSAPADAHRVDEAVKRLTQSILADHRTRHFSTAFLPDRAAVLEILEKLISLMYPGFFGPRALVFAKGFLDVADTGNKRIVRFDAEGKVVGTWGGAGNEPGRFVEPVGLASDAAGRVWVADTGNHRIQVFEGDGAFVRQFPVFGWKDFYTEPYLAAGPSDSVFATDSWKGRFASYDASGSIQRSFKAEGLKSPTGIVIDPFGRILVSDRANDRIYAWSLTDLMK